MDITDKRICAYSPTVKVQQYIQRVYTFTTMQEVWNGVQVRGALRSCVSGWELK